MRRSSPRSPRRVILAVGGILLVVGSLVTWAASEWPVWQAWRAAEGAVPRALRGGRRGRRALGSASARLRRGAVLPRQDRDRDGRPARHRRRPSSRRVSDIPPNSWTYFGRLLNAQQGRLAQAHPILERAFVEGGAPDLMIDEALSRVLLEMYDFPAAAVVLKRWGDDAPTDPRPPLWMAQIHRRTRGRVPPDSCRFPGGTPARSQAGLKRAWAWPTNSPSRIATRMRHRRSTPISQPGLMIPSAIWARGVTLWS